MADEEYDPNAWPEDRSRPGQPRPNGLIPPGPRWGLRTMGCLVVVILAIVASSAAGHHTLITLVALLGGLAGAVYCTGRGLIQMQRRD